MSYDNEQAQNHREAIFAQMMAAEAKRAEHNRQQGIRAFAELDRLLQARAAAERAAAEAHAPHIDADPLARVRAAGDAIDEQAASNRRMRKAVFGMRSA